MADFLLGLDQCSKRLFGSVGGWRSVLPSHTCELSGSLRQLFKERVAEYSTPECHPLRCLLRQTPWFLPMILEQPGSAYLQSSTLGSQADFHQPQDAQQPKTVRPPTNCLPPENTDLSTRN
ncbi:hypothetical protein AMECASPLE_021794 [Ameca splendens]|uniref:Uncharacterized protein n=1 Tax=Ameca splendens TaxID=208324 RepID=A0ABV0XGN3_9TELE